MLRLRANLRPEIAATGVGGDEVARDAGEPAGSVHVRRWRRRAAGAGISASEQRTRDLDWFHITMRLTVLQQQTKALQAERPDEGVAAAKQMESVKHLLWHGNVDEALDRIDSLFIDLDLIRRQSDRADKLAVGSRTYGPTSGTTA